MCEKTSSWTRTSLHKTHINAGLSVAMRDHYRSNSSEDLTAILERVWCEESGVPS